MFYLGFGDRTCVPVLRDLHVTGALRQDMLGLGDCTFSDRVALADIVGLLGDFCALLGWHDVE